MALRSYVVQNEVWVDASSFVMNETGNRGKIVVHDTSVTGVGGLLDDANSIVKRPDVALGSGEYPAGVLLTDVVNKDLTRTHLNQHRREVQVGGKVSVMKIGSIDTNDVAVGVTPSPGLPCYFTTEGAYTTSSNSGSVRVGTFRGGKDTDGYVRIDILIV